VLICCERKILLLVAGGWFILREKYCWLVADKPNEQGAASAICLLVQLSLSRPILSLHAP
jgi:hypothetical protein